MLARLVLAVVAMAGLVLAADCRGRRRAGEEEEGRGEEEEGGAGRESLRCAIDAVAAVST